MSRRSKTRLGIVMLLIAVPLGGCAQLTTYNKVRTFNPILPQQAFIDAKQRVVYTVPGSALINGKVTAVVRTCAEPSPDALSALAASGSGGLSAEDKVSLQAAFALSETASGIGLRTQSIQLMRDAMYRLCEGMASGALSTAQFETLHRRFQNSMVAILAIEQLTGTVRPGSAQLSTSAGVGAAKDIAALTESTAKARQDSNDADAKAAVSSSSLDKAKAAADAYLKTNGGTIEALDDAKKAEYAKLTSAVTTAQAAKATADTAATAATEKLATYETGMKAIGGGNLTTSGTANTTGGTGGALTGDAATAIAKAVASIVSEELDLGFFREACATLFVAQIEGRVASAGSADLLANCKAYAAATVTQMEVGNELDRAIVRNVDMLTNEKVAVTIEHDDDPPTAASVLALTNEAASKGPKRVVMHARRRPRQLAPY